MIRKITLALAASCLFLSPALAFAPREMPMPVVTVALSTLSAYDSLLAVAA